MRKSLLKSADKPAAKTRGNMREGKNRAAGGTHGGAVDGMVMQPMVSPAPKAGDKLVRGGATAGRPGQIVSAANRWRENYNPIRNFTMRRVVELLELGQRGDTAYLQWAYHFAERRNATLAGLIARCEAPLAQFDWHIKIKNEPPPGLDERTFVTLADEQRRTLQDAYNGIDNLRAAILHLHKADFRGYAHLQKHRTPDGDVAHLEILDQWCICRDGLNGNWWWNPDSRSTSAPLQFLGADFCIGGDRLPLADFIIRECERPIDEIGLVDTARRMLCEKDWDGFIEIYGIPGGVVEMPANVPPGKEAEYEAAAKQVSEGGSGAMPSGSKYYPNNGPRSEDPFTPRLKRLDEALILAGTGGKLTMMTESNHGEMRGSSKVHDKTFGEIANGRARNIAEIFQRQFDAEVLDRQHPDEPHLVYFDFGDEGQEDLGALCRNVLALSQAGKITDTQWLAEKTGYQLAEEGQR
jgi:phage gp29-like protein